MFVSVFVAETCAGKKSYKTNILQTIYQFVLRWFGSFEINNLCTDEGTFNILFVKKKTAANPTCSSEETLCNIGARLEACNTKPRANTMPFEASLQSWFSLFFLLYIVLLS